ncbi:hypothetical protein [Mycobacterium sp. E2479]|uniref:hypothetical protein n=1 Tax=Mycobacterium sp. E2479 TaxID=1834134 RepID=UPI000801982C|nr:hypothetical protein [Mycobacterium sp. E2479]OBH56090.1 hypothetical protein A5686_05260 [Mycobacterium sp. E2479]
MIFRLIATVAAIAVEQGPVERANVHAGERAIALRMSDIAITQDKHGPPDARRYTHDPTWQMRGLSELHLEFTPIS